jgi:hypothetical protein
MPVAWLRFPVGYKTQAGRMEESAIIDRTVQTMKDQNAEMDPGELQSLIDSAVRQVRAERGVKGKVRKA